MYTFLMLYQKYIIYICSQENLKFYYISLVVYIIFIVLIIADMICTKDIQTFENL